MVIGAKKIKFAMINRFEFNEKIIEFSKMQKSITRGFFFGGKVCRLGLT